MDYEQFLEQVKADLQEQFPYMNVEIRSVEKLQGQSYTGISITPEGSNAGATMNLHSQYEMLQDGVPTDIVMRRIENLAADAVNQIPQVEASTLSDYEQMKHTLIMQAVPVGPNRALLETIPHRTMEDIAIVYRFQLEHRENADATVLVTNQMLQNYGRCLYIRAAEKSGLSPLSGRGPFGNERRHDPAGGCRSSAAYGCYGSRRSQWSRCHGLSGLL